MKMQLFSFSTIGDDRAINKPDVNSKTKDAEREKLVDEFNEKVLAGTMKYFSKAPDRKD